MIPLLEPIFQGEWAPRGRALVHSDPLPGDGVRVSALARDPDRLDAVLRGQARRWNHGGPDLRAVASAWSLQYLELLLPPVCAAATLLHHVFPVQAGRTAVVLDAQGTPLRFHIDGLGAALPEAPAPQRYSVLLWEHLDPLFAALSGATRLPRKILWGNAARHLEAVFAHALAHAGPYRPRVERDDDALLRQRRWHGTRDGGAPAANPLYGVQRAMAGAPAVRLHQQCCLYYLLPGETHCGACPLHPRHHGAR